MAPTNLGGRPRIPWTTSRRRKLVRLYLMTDIGIADIKEVLSTDGFSPGTRNIQTQLSTLLPDNVKAWRQYRPSGIHRGKSRLARLKHCRDIFTNRVRQEPAPTKQVSHSTCRDQEYLSEISPFYDPTRHYKDQTLSSTAHCSMQQLSKETSSQSLDQVEEPERNQTDEPGSNESSMSPGTSVVPPKSGLSEDVEPIAFISEKSTSEDTFTVLMPQVEEQALAGPKGLKRSHSKVASVTSSPRRSLSWRGVSRFPSARWSQINSVLSLSVSWRSELASKLSFFSKGSTSMNESSWMSQYIDKSKVAPSSRFHPQFDSGSLHYRPCCSFVDAKSLTPENMPCEICGYAQSHRLARFSLSDDLELIDCTMQDRHGNTPLHHAAAAGNTLRVIQLMSKAGRSGAPNLHHKNSDGQTYMHVLRIENAQDLQDFETILKYARRRGLQFSEQEKNGWTIMDRMRQMVFNSSLDSAQQREARKYVEQKFLPQEKVVKVPEPSVEPVTTTWVLPAVDEELMRDGEKGSYVGVVEIVSPSPASRTLQASATTATQPGARSSTFLWTARTEPAKREMLSISERDSNGDTLLLSTLKKWPQGAPATRCLKQIIEHSDVHVPDCHGYTALAIAARRGLRDVVASLLERGANPNTQNLYKTCVLDHVFEYLWRAQKEEDDSLYAKILSCTVLLIDRGAESVATKMAKNA